MSSQTSDDEVLKISEAAKLLGIHPQTLRNWENKGYIVPEKTLKGHRRYKRSELQTFLSPDVGQSQIRAFQPQPEVTGLDDRLSPEMFIQDYDDRHLIPVKSQVKFRYLDINVSYSLF